MEESAVTYTIPEALTAVFGTGPVVLVAGPELPSLRGAPGRSALLADLIGRSGGDVGNAGREMAQRAVVEGNLDLAARFVRATGAVVRTDTEAAYATATDTAGYDALARIPFAGVIDLGWDHALLDAFAARSPTVVSGGSGDVVAAARDEGFPFVWMAGDPATEDVALGPGELRARMRADEDLERFLTGVAQSSSLVFLGALPTDVFAFFDALPGAQPWTRAQIKAAPLTMPSILRNHAVCEIDDLWPINARELEARDVLPVGYQGGDTALAELVGDLARAVTPQATAAEPPEDTAATPVLGRVVLTNIGPFEELDLTLGPAWNLLLGNNGCGKSTVLRAVALGLCGDHPRAVETGAELLRSGCDSGSVELQVGAARFRTELVRSRTGGMVRVRTSSLTPLQQGSWAVLGFPAVRGRSVTTPTGISAAQSPEPRVEDLLPLLLDSVDHRLDDIKQWIVNVDARARRGEERARQLLDRFFAVLTDLTPGVTLAFDSVDDVSWQVWVRTDDGVVSIDRLSQGMSSILAWVGTLLQRMYDIHPLPPDPAAEPAFVLLDELDAHLHPAWQRLLPGLLRTHFPRVQFLATSHSPLVASDLLPGELFVARREPQTSPDGEERLVAVVTPVDVDTQGLRADQILTSDLFGLMTSRSPGHQRDVARYSELYAASERTAAQEDELTRLRDRLSAAYRDGETAEQRAAQAAEEEVVGAMLTDPTLAGERPAHDRVAAVFDDLERGS